jgi:SUMO ligase MMS21 Smc5/6 complex component
MHAHATFSFRSTCGHSYSGEAIRGYLAGRGQRKCPASGCNKWIALSDLRKDRELERRAKAAARRLQDMDTDQNEDEDDVIE